MLTSALQRRVSRRGASPLLTYYDGTSRVELSAATFANWVDKTANLIASLGHDDGEPIDVAVAQSHPAHWVSLVWVAAAWQRGCPVVPGVSGAGLLVVGPGDERRAALTVACRLHPLGLGFQDPPERAIDFTEVLAQPDLHDESPLATAMVWDSEAVPEVEARDDRILIADPVAGWDTVRDCLLAPVAGLGSTVVCVGLPPDETARLASTERARPMP